MIYGNAVAIDGGEVALTLQVDGGEIQLNNQVDGGEVGLFFPIYPEAYTGQTEVTPSEQTQTLPTNGLMMLSDITVLPIPYPNGNDMAYGSSSCLVGEAKVGTAYVWTEYDGDNIAIINKAVVGTAAVV